MTFGAIASIGFALRDYEPYRITQRQATIDRVELRATLSPADEKLRIDHPNCMAME